MIVPPGFSAGSAGDQNRQRALWWLRLEPLRCPLVKG